MCLEHMFSWCNKKTFNALRENIQRIMADRSALA